MSCPGESVEVGRRAQEFSRFDPDFQGLDILEILPNLDILLHIGLGLDLSFMDSASRKDGILIKT